MTLVIDTGKNCIGVLSAEDQTYIFYEGSNTQEAIDRILMADQVITFNGDQYDLVARSGFPALEDFPQEKHVDMEPIAWNAHRDLFGKGLKAIYAVVFGSIPPYDGTHEGHNRRDCLMTLHLWERWCNGDLAPADAQACPFALDQPQ